MPRRDRTGPFGDGPMTGKGLRCCASPGVNPRPGAKSGWFNWSGGGYGWRHRFFAIDRSGSRRGRQNSPALSDYGFRTSGDELDYLRDYASGLEEALNAVKAQIAEIHIERKDPASE